jgi:hypothetical protein
MHICLQTLIADLLGVAATDIPIKDIEKLTYKYKVTCTLYHSSCPRLKQNLVISKNQ